MTQFKLHYKETMPFSDQAVQLNLLANTAVAFTVPGTSADMYRIQFSWAYNANVYVGYNVAPVVPPANAATSSPNVEFRPGFDGSGRYVRGGDVLTFISLLATGDSGFSLLKLPSQ